MKSCCSYQEWSHHLPANCALEDHHPLLPNYYHLDVKVHLVTNPIGISAGQPLHCQQVTTTHQPDLDGMCSMSYGSSSSDEIQFAKRKLRLILSKILHDSFLLLGRFILRQAVRSLCGEGELVTLLALMLAQAINQQGRIAAVQLKGPSSGQCGGEVTFVIHESWSGA